jgi:O-6-methylguanine DNA methyltransferase
MMNNDATTVGSALEQLRTTAPPTVLPRVLAATGLADRYTTITGPTGPLYVAWSDQGVSAVAPATDDREFEDTYAARVGRSAVRDDAIPQRLANGILRTIESGKLGRLPVDLSELTPFQRQVLETTATIPRGELRSYGWVAREMGRPGAVRAVGSALNRNPVPVLIPCHRVGRSDGTVGEYAFGPEMKRELLRFEGLDPDALDDDAARGVRLVGSDTTHIFCVPTCRNARRITDAHRVEFRSESGAAGAGYRPCKVCRPAAAA